MAVLPFSEVYLSECDTCGTALEDWEWYEDDLRFRTTCSCGCEYTLEPTAAVLDCESPGLDEDEEEDE